ncbi:hypothetical protein Afil01_59220 [Actinorhabdospora filicis]|uniref:Protein GrpE n=1 Tax=Actinorhabdospora filicis TaxID=1785913 RepID=A0A9W6SQI9_9ACTN|nr:hypothetical protein Afil01_59220 [Actinorhabdospora filicis]
MTDENTEAAGVEEETPSPGDAGAETEVDELTALKQELEERTDDLKRVTAEYANYRKRVDRDRKLVADQATISVVTGLLPVLDDLDRARSHGDLTGPFGSVAEQLTGALTKLGLTAFGEKGDAFDPNRHEAVAHLLSPDVSEQTCIDVMRRGYELGDRLVRPALVAVADPDPSAAKPAEEPAEATESAGEPAVAEESGGEQEAATVGDGAGETPSEETAPEAEKPEGDK